MNCLLSHFFLLKKHFCIQKMQDILEELHRKRKGRHQKSQFDLRKTNTPIEAKVQALCNELRGFL